MPSDKPLFESRDLGSTDPGNSDLFDLSETGDTDEASGKGSAKKYAGRERRSENRRSHHDRRGEVRFDKKSSDRRVTEGRRSGDKSPKFW